MNETLAGNKSRKEIASFKSWNRCARWVDFLIPVCIWW